MARMVFDGLDEEGQALEAGLTGLAAPSRLQAALELELKNRLQPALEPEPSFGNTRKTPGHWVEAVWGYCMTILAG